MDKRILLLIGVFCAGSLAFFVYRKQFYAHSGIRYEIRPGNMMIHVGDSISYQDKTEDASRWKWNFGDGEYSAEQAGTHAYLQPGHYPIQLSVFGPFGTLHDEHSVLEVLPAENAAPVHPEIFDSSIIKPVADVAAPSPKVGHTNPKVIQPAKPHKPHGQHDDLSDLESGGVEVKKGK